MPRYAFGATQYKIPFVVVEVAYKVNVATGEATLSVTLAEVNRVRWNATASRWEVNEGGSYTWSDSDGGYVFTGGTWHYVGDGHGSHATI